MHSEIAFHPDIKLVHSIAQKMVNPSIVKAKITDRANRNPAPLHEFGIWHDLSIAGGFPGVLPLFIELDRLFPQEGWDLIAHNYILEITQAINGSDSLSVTLFGGATGIALFLRQASRNERRYKKILDKLDDLLIREVELSHLSRLHSQLDKSIPVDPALYEVIQGLSGIGIYALENYLKPKFKELVDQTIKLFVLLTKPIEIKGKTVPGWYVSPEFFFLESEKEDYPNGNFNLGLSHGIPGVLAFLSIASIWGVQLEGQIEAIERITKWIQGKRKRKNNRYFWDVTISFEEEISEISTSSLGSKDAWCYGTPGVARALYLAGNALNNDAIKDFALESFGSIFNSPLDEWRLSGPTFCHGIAGLLMITNLMARDSRSPFLFEQVGKLREILLSYYDPSSNFGFKNAELQKDKGLEYAWIERADLLEGVTGVLLTLLSLHLDESYWYKPFLIDKLKVFHWKS